MNQYTCEEVEVDVDGRSFEIAGSIDVERPGGIDADGFIDETMGETRTTTITSVVEIEPHGDGHMCTPVALSTLSESVLAAMRSAIEDRAEADYERACEARENR